MTPFIRVEADSIKRGKSVINDPMNVDPELVKLGIHSTYFSVDAKM